MGVVVVQGFFWGRAWGRCWLNSLHEVPTVNDWVSQEASSLLRRVYRRLWEWVKQLCHVRSCPEPNMRVKRFDADGMLAGSGIGMSSGLSLRTVRIGELQTRGREDAQTRRVTTVDTAMDRREEGVGAGRRWLHNTSTSKYREINLREATSKLATTTTTPATSPTTSASTTTPTATQTVRCAAKRSITCTTSGYTLIQSKLVPRCSKRPRQRENSPRHTTQDTADKSKDSHTHTSTAQEP